MSRHIKHGKQWVCVTLFLITFLWVLLPESLSGPSVLWPSLLTLILAFMTRDIYFALLLGAFSGCLLLDHGNPFRAFIHFFDQHLIPVLAKPWNVSVILFSFFMVLFYLVLLSFGILSFFLSFGIISLRILCLWIVLLLLFISILSFLSFFLTIFIIR